MIFFTLTGTEVYAQFPQNRIGGPRPAPPPPKVTPVKPARRPNGPGPNEILSTAVLSQEVDGPWRRLRVAAQLETTEMLLKADEIDYNEENGAAEARGHVYYQNFITGEELKASKVEYNLKEENGKFYDVEGSSPSKVQYRPGLLLTDNPFIFQGKWAEKIKERYILYDGFVTTCKIPKPYWRLTGPRFDIIPGERAIAYRSLFKVKKVPLLYAPAFYKSLEKEPRKSGFLTPSFSHSNRRGWVTSIGYYWAINRSFDLMYRPQYFSQRGFAHEVDFRGKPRPGTDFNFTLYGVNDKGRLIDNGDRIKEGGYRFSLIARSDLGRGWQGSANINYLSSFTFQQAFTQSFNEAVFSEVNASGWISKAWDNYTFHAVLSQHRLFQSSAATDLITIRKLPSFELIGREREVARWGIPIWFSFDTTASFLRRQQPLFETRSFVDRFDFAPRVSTALDFKGFHLAPSLTLHGTSYGSQRDPNTYQVNGQNLFRKAADIQVELISPALERIFNGPKWLGGKLKHVVEERITYRNVTGVDDFRKIIRFDEVDILNNTSEADFSVINRVYAKRGDDVQEVLSWEVTQRRYFDPTLGGAIIPGQRNVFASSISVTGYAFFAGPRNYSPVVSVLRLRPTPSVGVEWRTDYDPFYTRISNSSITADARIQEKWFFGVGHNQVRGAPGVSPNANQMLARGGFGREGQRGWSAGMNLVYDYRINQLQFATTQVTYNSDCCGISVQHRRLSFGTRNENQFLVSFSVANIGSFGTLRRQEKLF